MFGPEQLDILFILSSLSAFGLVFVTGSTDSCDVSEQRRCRRALLGELDQLSSSRITPQQQEQSCRKMEGDLNCLALHVTRCPTPNRNGELISRALNHLQDNCEQFGGWWSYDCFHLEEIKKCEKLFALKDSKMDEPSCREYDRFRHCVSDVIRKQCSSEDEASLGIYLLDSAGDFVWTCPHAAEPSSPVAREGWVGVQRPSSDTLVTSHSKKRTGSIAAEESHLRSVYSSAITGEGPYVTGCSARVTEETRGCLDRHQYERDQALAAREDEERLKKECCATWSYRRCLQNAVRIHCYDTREVDVQSAVDVIPQDRGFLCRHHWIYSCSGTSHFSVAPNTNYIYILLVTSTILLLSSRNILK